MGEEKRGFEALPEVRFIERTGEDFPAYLIPVDEYDMQRPGVYSSGEYFEGNGVEPTKVSKAGRPHKIVSRGMELLCGPSGLNAGTAVDGATKKVLFCADLAINFGNDKSGTKWIIKRNCLKLYDLTHGPVVAPSHGYLELDEFEEWKKSEAMQERVRQQRLERLMDPEKFVQKPEFQRQKKADATVADA